MRNRLQIRYCETMFPNREEAVAYIGSKFNRNAESGKGLTALVAEPLVCFYNDTPVGAEGDIREKSKAILAIGKGGDGVTQLKNVGNEPYFLIDITKSEENIAKLQDDSKKHSDEIADILAQIAGLVDFTQAVHDELDTTQIGAGLNGDGKYIPNDGKFIKDSDSLMKAIIDLNAALVNEEDERIKEDARISTKLDNVQVASGLLETGEFPALEAKDTNYLDNSKSLFENDSILDSKLFELKGDFDAEVGKTSDIQNELDATQVGAGLLENGDYDEITSEGSNYLKQEHSLMGSIMKLDSIAKAIQDELDETQVGAGLGVNGSYTTDKKSNYIKGEDVTSLYKADKALDIALKAEETARISKDNAIIKASGLNTADGTYVKSEETHIANATSLADADDKLSQAIVAENQGRTSMDNAIKTAVGLSDEGHYIEKIDPKYIKEAGSIYNAISMLDESLKTEEATRIQNDSKLQSELDTTQIGAGLNKRGEYEKDAATSYIKEAVSLKDADKILDQSLKAEEFSRTAKDNSLQSELDTTQTGAGLEANGTYLQNKGATHIKDAASLMDADVKLSNALDTEIETRINEDANIQSELDDTQTGAGLETNGAYSADQTSSYLKSAKSLKEADKLLDTQVKANADAIIKNKIVNRDGSIVVDSLSEENTTIKVAVDDDTIKKATSAENKGKLYVNVDKKTIHNGLDGKLSVNVDGKSITADENGVISVSSDAFTKYNGSKAITVTDDPENVNSKVISLKINEATEKDGKPLEKILQVSDGGLLSTLSLKWLHSEAGEVKDQIQLIGKDNLVISSIDVADFLKDGMLSNATYDPVKKEITLVFNTDAGKDNVVIPVGDLVDEYISGNGISVDSKPDEQLQSGETPTKVISIVIDNKGTDKDKSDKPYIVVDAQGLRTQGIRDIQNSLDKEIDNARKAEGENKTAIEAEKGRAEKAEQANAKAIEDEQKRAEGEEGAIRKSIGDFINDTEGAETVYGRIKANTKAISNEADRATGKENEISNHIGKEKDPVTGTTVHSLINKNAKDISDEITRAKGKEKDIEEALSKEVERAKGEEKAISDTIGNFGDASTLFKTTVQGRIKKVEEDLTEEIGKSRDNEQKITDNIGTFDDRSKDHTVQGRIKKVEEDLSSEILTARTNEGNIVTNLKGGVSDKNDTLKKLEDNLNGEITRAKSAEDVNSTEINGIKEQLGDTKDVEGTILGRLKTAENSIKTISGDSDGSFKKYTDDAIKAIKGQATEKFDTLFEIETRIGEDRTTIHNLEVNKVDKNTEDISKANTAIQENKNAISAEVSDRKVAIQGEKDRATEAEKGLSDRISSNLTEIDAIKAKIGGEGGSSITDRISALEATDATHTSQISTINNSLGDHNRRINENKGIIDDVNGVVSNEKSFRYAVNVEKLRAEGVESQISINLGDEENRAKAEELRIAELASGNTAAIKSEVIDRGTAITAEKTRAEKEEARIEGLVTSEKERAEKIESALRTDLDNEIKRSSEKNTEFAKLISGNTANITTNKESIIAEKTARESADTALGTRITDETNRATSAETVLTNSISVTNGNLKTEETNRKSEISRVETDYKKADADINKRFTDEISALKAKDNELTNSISAENTRATKEEGVLRNSITEEAGLRSNADTKLNGRIDKEVTDRTNDVTTIKGELTNIKNSIVANKIVSEDKTIVVSSGANTSIRVNTDDKTIKKNDEGAISVCVNPNDKVLSSGNTGIQSTLNLTIDKDGSHIRLKGLNDQDIATIDTSTFLVDGMLEDARYDENSKDLILVFNTDAKSKTVRVNLAGLFTAMKAGPGIDKSIDSTGDVVISGKIDGTDNEYLKLTSIGFQVVGVNNAIALKVKEETDRATGVENTLTGKCNTLEIAINNEKTNRENGDNNTLRDANVYSDGLNSAMNTRVSSVEDSLKPGGAVESRVANNEAAIAKLNGGTQVQDSVANKIMLSNDTLTKYIDKRDAEVTTIANGASSKADANAASIQGLVEKTNKTNEDVSAERLRAMQAEDGLNTRTGNLESRMTGAESNRTADKQLIDANTSGLASANATIGEHTTAIQDITGRLSTAEGEIDALQIQANASTTNIEGLTTRMGAAEKDIDKIQSQIGGGEGLTAKIETNTANIAALDGRVAKNEGDILKIQQTIGGEGGVSLTDRITKLESTDTTHTSQIEGLTTKMGAVEGKLNPGGAIESRIAKNEADIEKINGPETIAGSIDNKIKILSDKLYNANVKENGSIKHYIDYAALGSADVQAVNPDEVKQHSLVRKLKDSERFYVSNKLEDMEGTLPLKNVEKINFTDIEGTLPAEKVMFKKGDTTTENLQASLTAALKVIDTLTKEVNDLKDRVSKLETSQITEIQGTTKQIAVTKNETGKILTIGFAKDAEFISGV